MPHTTTAIRSADRSDVTMSARPEGQSWRSRGVMAVLPHLLDFIVPLVAFYALTAAG